MVVLSRTRRQQQQHQRRHLKIWFVRCLCLLGCIKLVQDVSSSLWDGDLYISDATSRGLSSLLCQLELESTAATTAATPVEASAATRTTSQQQQHVNTTNKKVAAQAYAPSPIEQYLYTERNALDLQLHPADACSMWRDTFDSPFKPHFQAYRADLHQYSTALSSFQPPKQKVVRDLRQSTDPAVCDALELHPDGLPGLFPSMQLSYMEAHDGSRQYLEPITTPMRHPHWCKANLTTTTAAAADSATSSYPYNPDYLLRQDFLVHDYAHWCRHKLLAKPQARTVFLDIGASLDIMFGATPPILELLSRYNQFGIQFDHIYAYESRQKSAEDLYHGNGNNGKTHPFPPDWAAAYHYINMKVPTDPKLPMHPWTLLKNHFTEDDFVVVKLDVDAYRPEYTLTHQLLNDTALHGGLIDQFYFEHHVHLVDFHRHKETAATSLELFRQLRQLGIPAHYWV